MCMVVLDTNFVWDVRVKSIFCCQVFGMQVVGDCFWINIEEALEVLDAVTEGGQRLQVLQVANMMADKSLSSLAQTEGILEVSAAGQQWHRYIEREGNRFRR